MLRRTVTCLRQLRLRRPALVRGEAAARREAAPGGPYDQGRRQAGDGGQRLRLVGGALGQGGEERLGVAVPGGREEGAHARPFGDLARVHHGDLVDPLGDHAEVVRDQDHRHAEPLPQLVDELQDLVLGGDVQGGGRLVRDEQLGLADQGHGDGDALPHAAAELVRVVLHPLAGLRHAHQPQGLLGLLPRLGLGGAGVQQQRLGDLRADRHGGVERGERVLEDHADGVAAHVAQDRLGGGRQVGAVEEDAPAGDASPVGQEPEDGQRGHGLAAAGLPHDAEGLARREVEVDAVEGVHGAGAGGDLDVQVFDGQELVGHGGCLSSSGAARRRRRAGRRR